MGFPLKLNFGKRALIFQYKKQFRIPENEDFYTPRDFQAAERKFLKYALETGWPLPRDAGGDSPTACEDAAASSEPDGVDDGRRAELGIADSGIDDRRVARRK